MSTVATLTSTPVRNTDEPVFSVLWLNAFGSRLLARHRATMVSLGNLETSFLSEEIAATDISRPIFVCGLARSGTTVILELLAKHGETASQRYLDYPFVFTPYWWNRYLELSRRGPSPLKERSHKDGLMVSAESPEAMEEPLWMHYFPACHDASVSSIIDETTSHPQFESFYTSHMAKLLLVRKRNRYLAKGNYHIARLRYLAHLFPQARFVIPVRDPVAHIASSMKQHDLFTRGQAQSADARRYLAQIGHFEFGLDRTPINVNTLATQNVERFWKAGDEVGGWSAYWAAIHDHIADMLEASKGLAGRVIIVGYEKLCANAAAHATALIRHCGLATDPECLCWAKENISEKTYYRPDFSDEDLSRIRKMTGPALERLQPFFLDA